MKKIISILYVLAMAFGVISCTNNMDEPTESGVGYLTLDIATNNATITRADAPVGYDPEKLAVEIIDSDGEVVVSTNDFENDTDLNPKNGNKYYILPVGEYTIVAHSAHWDGDGSGFDTPYYYGETTVNVQKAKHYYSASITCTLANVEVSVNFSDEFMKVFNSATVTIKSKKSGIGARVFEAGEDKSSAYFPVSELEAILAYSGGPAITKPITGVEARQHIVLNYYVNMGTLEEGITVQVDPTTNKLTYTIKVPCLVNLPTEFKATANAWSNFAILEAEVTHKNETEEFKPEEVTMQWKKKDDATWNTIPNDQITQVGDKFTAKITGLIPSTEETSSEYTFKVVYNGSESPIEKECDFTTEEQIALYNGSFEEWHYRTSNNIAYPTKDKSVIYWSSSNPGSGKALKELAKMTDKTTEQVHSGTYGAKLASGQALGFLAAASIFTGSFGELNTTTQTASLNWGVPFTSRPTALKGYMMYVPGAVDITSSSAKDGTPLPSDAPGKGELDHAQIYCALLDIDAPLSVTNADMNSFPKWDSDPRVIAYGALTQKTAQNGLTEFNIDLEYHDLTKTPKYLLIVGSAGKYGDYFHGSSSSVLYLDDFELVYGDNPVQQ